MKRLFASLTVAVTLLLSTGGALSCDNESSCTGGCPVGKRFGKDGTCDCEPFDAGYCAKASDCPDAYCPAADAAGACGKGQEWATTICGCYPLPSRD